MAINSYDEYKSALRRISDLEESLEPMAKVYFASERGGQITVHQAMSHTKELLAQRRLEIAEYEKRQKEIAKSTPTTWKEKLGSVLCAGMLAFMGYGIYHTWQEAEDKVTRFGYDRVLRRHELYHEARPLDLDVREDYHPTVQRIADLDRRFRGRLNTNNDGVVSRKEFSHFLDNVGYGGRRIGDEETYLRYGFCDEPITHGHGEGITIEHHVVLIAPMLQQGGDYYDLDPTVVEDWLNGKRQ